jgi:hypothetical protein
VEHSARRKHQLLQYTGKEERRPSNASLSFLRSIRLSLTIRSKTREECDKNDVKLKDSSLTPKVKRRRYDAERLRGFMHKASQECGTAGAQTC